MYCSSQKVSSKVKVLKLFSLFVLIKSLFRGETTSSITFLRHQMHYTLFIIRLQLIFTVNFPTVRRIFQRILDFKPFPKIITAIFRWIMNMEFASHESRPLPPPLCVNFFYSSGNQSWLLLLREPISSTVNS